MTINYYSDDLGKTWNASDAIDHGAYGGYGDHGGGIEGTVLEKQNGELKLLPFWDPLRSDPCFEKIVNSLALK